MTSSPAQKAAQRLAGWNDGDEVDPAYTPDSLAFQRDLRAVLAERDALRDEWEEIAAGITTEIPEVGALWPMVSEISGSLCAARQHFRNEIEAHNRAKAERDAARAEAARLREALQFYSGIHEPGLSNPNAGPWGVASADFGAVARAALAGEAGHDR